MPNTHSNRNPAQLEPPVKKDSHFHSKEKSGEEGYILVQEKSNT
jgi:hypothetical protein